MCLKVVVHSLLVHPCHTMPATTERDAPNKAQLEMVSYFYSVRLRIKGICTEEEGIDASS